MASATKGNQTSNKSTPGATFKQLSHTQNSGSNRVIIAFFQISNGNNKSFTGATYGGDAMTELYIINRGGLASRMAVYYMIDPPEGANTLRVNFNQQNWNSMSFYARSFTDCGGIGAHLKEGGSTSPHNENLTVENDSLIMMTCASNAAIQTMQIPTGTTVPDINHTTNKNIGVGAISNSGHSAGSIPLRTTVNNNNVTLDAVEIKGLSGGGSTNNSDFFLVM